MNSRTITLWAMVLVSLSLNTNAQLEFESAPIHYGKESTSDRVAALGKRLESGELKLDRDAKHGYLPAVLKALQVPESSQTLVFSKTSFQLHKISPGDRARCTSTTIRMSVGCRAAISSNSAQPMTNKARSSIRSNPTPTINLAYCETKVSA